MNNMINKTSPKNTLARLSNSDISPSLVQAYLETDYQVLSDNPFTLKVDVLCPALARLHQVHQVTCSAFVTACNPYSQQLNDTDNAKRQIELEQALIHRGFVLLNGVGQHPSNDWPGEPSYLVLGIDLDAAKILGNQFEQNAIIWSSHDAEPHLILLR